MRSTRRLAFGRFTLAAALPLLGCSSTDGEGSPPGNAAGAGAASGAAGNAGSNSGAAGFGGGGAAAAGSAGTAGAPLAAGAGGALPQGGMGGEPGLSKSSFLYVSGYAPPITTFSLSHESGELTPGSTVESAAEGEPTFIAFSPDKKYAYATDEQLDGPLASVIAFKVDAASGALTVINREDVGTPVNAHVGVHQSGKWVLSANYDGNSVTVFDVRADGGLAPGKTPVPAGTRAHQIVFDSTGTRLFVPCLEGHIAVFDFADGVLTPRSPPTIEVEGGPRHMAFSPDEKFAYVLTQNESTITQFSYDAAQGSLTPVETVKAAPNGALSAHIEVHRSGKFLYASNRSDNSIAIFGIEPITGKLSSLGYQREMLNFPRFFAIDPTGHWMVVASQKAAHVLLHGIDQSTGLLSVVGSPVSVPPEPTFVALLSIP